MGYITAEELDKKFDEGKEDIIEHLLLSSARRINQEQIRLDVEVPVWLVQSLDQEAARMGVTRQSIINAWLLERLEAELAARS